MFAEQFIEVSLSKIRANPHNPRQRFEGPEFENLEKSIESVGVLQPILCRPIEDPVFTHEVVFGGRRFKACCNIAQRNGGLDAKILARVKPLTDDEAFDLMIIENLQRDDLTPLEEARSFKIFVDCHGHGAIAELARRININERYIRRRLSVLELPDTMLKSWDKGDITFTHLEHISRLPNKKDQKDLFQEALQRDMTTKDIRRRIEGISPALDTAKFEREKAGCLTCESNSDVQAETHGHQTNAKSVICLNSNCFKKNQNNYFLKNWKKTGLYKKHKTTGFRFFEDVGWGKFNNIYDSQKVTKKCLECDKFVTLLDLAGTARQPRACLGEAACCSAQVRYASSTKIKIEKKKEETDPDTPRVLWHGEYFREIFYKQRIPEQLDEIKNNISSFNDGFSTFNAVIDRLSLLTLVKQSRAIHAWFAKRHGLVKDERIDEVGFEWYFLSSEEILNVVKDMTPDQVRDEMHAAVSQVIISSEYYATIRRQVGDHIGIDLATEWAITAEYLQKKTKAEMMAIGEKFEIFKDKKAQSFLFEKLMKKRGRFNTCKKDELIRVFTESGVDLSGKVPDEILK